MSFFDTMKNLAGELVQGAGAQGAATDPAVQADHVAAQVGSMDETSLLNLGEQLLQTFTHHEAYDGDGAQAAQEAGTTAEAVASGSPDAISTLLGYAKAHPQILQTALSAFAARQAQ